MQILVSGQCTLHWGRMEFGNIGNHYVVSSFFRQLARTFPDARIHTTFQLSGELQAREGVSCLPMSLYYDWGLPNLQIARHEHDLVTRYLQSGDTDGFTPLLRELLKTDLYINFSGDLWGDNASQLAADRFEVGLLKDRLPQRLGIPTAMLAGSPGPFSQLPADVVDLARETWRGFDLVTNREPSSTELLSMWGFPLERTRSLACPAFLFEGADRAGAQRELARACPSPSGRPRVALLLCGWNFAEGPFSRWPRADEEYRVFVSLARLIAERLDADLFLMSHANGFDPSAGRFELLHGRDFQIMRELYEMLRTQGGSGHVYLMDGVYDAPMTHAILGQFDMVVSGRVHAAVAALSQNVPTVAMRATRSACSR